MAQVQVMEENSSAKKLSPEDEEEERKNFLSIIETFRLYRATSSQRVDKTEVYLNTLPARHQDMLQRYKLNLLRIRNCIDINYKVILKIIENVDSIFQEDDPSGDNCYHQLHKHLKVDEKMPLHQLDTERVQVTLKQIARDWSSDGAVEREQCYGPIISAIVKYFKDSDDLSKIRILVPGAGLGRLTYEIALRGFYCEGNEFSFFMLIAANFILNRCLYANQYTIYPYIHQYVNNLNRNDQTAHITFPDVSSIQSPPSGTFNMVAGDFLDVYKQPDYWHCVTTCFFIDCANNVIDFIEAIYNILKPNGIWINLGPLLYHYSDMASEKSIEPTYEDIEEIIKIVGFEILENDRNVPTKYTQNPRSMYKSEYSSVFFVCRKPDHPKTSPEKTHDLDANPNDDELISN